MLSDLTTSSMRSVARHAYWLSLLDDPCVIDGLGVVAKELDQAAEQIACCLPQTGFVDESEADGGQGD